MKEFKRLKNISKQFRPYIGLYNIEVPKEVEWEGIDEGSTIFIYDHYALDEEVREGLTTYCLRYDAKGGVSLDDIWLYWNCKKDEETFGGMYAPFAFIKKGICKGPFNEFDGMLYLEEGSADDFENMTVHLYSKEKRASTVVANSFKELNIQKNEPDRVRSEAIKTEGNQLFGEGKPNEAIDNFYEAILVDTTNPLPYNNIGAVGIRQAKTMHDSYRAESFFQLSYLVDDSEPIGIQGHYRALANRKSYDAAIPIAKKAVSVEKDDKEKAIIYSELAYYYKVTDRLKKARKACEKGFLLDANNELILKLLKEL
ncbi:tetratricopeptide repeat protein [Aquimarina pacifica]|uniref:tetratricopeptide repeat protein n=1 Tax=Aquimarina pacifica TaxID=1296415 RepID=UPI0004727CB7|nr:hypothetical protein [Aquimarina pacifica]